MNVEELTAEQLMELAYAKQAEGFEPLGEQLMAKAGAEQAPAPSTRTIEVEGLAVTVYEERLKSWHALDLMRKISRIDDLNLDALDALEEFVAYVSDVTMERLVEHLGGPDVPMERVVGALVELAVKLYPKG